MKIIVTGNCQAGPLSTILSLIPGAVVDDPIILHLAKKEDEAEHRSRLDAADVIIAQLTWDGFEPAHLRSKALRQRQDKTVLVWPNVFYAGQQPFLRYITVPGKGKLAGPLEFYHDIRVFDAWLKDRGGQISYSGYAGAAPTSARASLDALAERKAQCDAGVADLISGEKRPLFFTFNHPTTFLLCRLAERLGAALGRLVQFDESVFGEMLNRYIAPSSWTLPGAAPAYKGLGVTFEAGERIKLGGRAYYQGGEMHVLFRQCYDHLLPGGDLGRIVLTPTY